MNFLLSKGLVKRHRNCAKVNCRRRMILTKDTSKKDKYYFRCPKCRSTQSIRKGTFFEDSKLSIEDILSVAFCWSAKLPVKSASAMTEVCQNSVSQWYQFLREKCSETLISNPNYTFGGPGVVVQIDESLIARRKYNVGRVVEPQWVFGIYDTNTKLGHIELVEDRSAATLIPLIQKYVLPGSTIHSDQWPAYNSLNQLGYNHLTVNHSQNFVDPNTGTCTNAIEAYWSRVKKNVRLHWLSRRDQLPLRIDEFLWRDRLPTKKYSLVFQETLRLVAVS